MIRIESEGFINGEYLESSKLDDGVNSELINVLVELNTFSEELKKDFVVFKHKTPKEKQKVISMVVFVRLLELVLSFIILASKGSKK